MAAVKEFLQPLHLKEFASIWVGWDETTGHLPAIPAAVVVYGSVFVIGQILFNISKLLPQAIRQYAMDFVMTMTLCSYPFGHGILRKYYGEPGYLLAAIPLTTVSMLAFRNADGNPIDVWLKYFRKTLNLRKCLIKSVIQIFGGFAAYRLGMFVLNLELHPIYVEKLKDYYNQFCTTDLNVPLYLGFMIEFFGVIWETWFSSHTFLKNDFLNKLIKTLNAALMVSAGVHLTGMYLHPAMASGHTFGCGDTPRIAHIVIYWVGPIVGAWLSLQIQTQFSMRQKKSVSWKSKPKVAHSVRLTTADINGNLETENGVGKRRKRKFYHT